MSPFRNSRTIEAQLPIAIRRLCASCANSVWLVLYPNANGSHSIVLTSLNNKVVLTSFPISRRSLVGSFAKVTRELVGSVPLFAMHQVAPNSCAH
ncbi:hypothetical protein BLOT_008877 [Blomia tropicalis]|nr:hypothetical protein BLOT_008877 [Blomia tropicalis]